MANQVQKLSYVDSKLGVSLPGQQTTRVVYDSINAVAGQTFFAFFSNFAGKSIFQSNLTTNKLDSAESMVIKSIQIIANTVPFDLTRHLNLELIVGNQTVIKDFDPSFNSSNRGLAFDRLHSSFNSTSNVEVRLLTEIVLPPQVNFRLNLTTTTGAALGDDITVILKGYGRIFSAGNSF